MDREKHIRNARRWLQGTWRSDREKTISRWVFPKRVAGARLNFWKNLFGKLEVRYTARRIYTDSEGRSEHHPYTILWADEWSAVLLIPSDSGEKVQQIFFDGDWYYILAGRDIVEYFRRITPNSRSSRAR